MKYIILIVTIIISQFLHAEEYVVGDEFTWINRDGSPAKNTDSMKSIAGFGGWLVVTPDLDWWDKWNTPSDNVPYFSEAKEVSLGQKLTILTFYGNPLPDEKGMINLSCNIRVARPDGTDSVNQKNIPCATGELLGERLHVYLSQAVIEYVGEPGDPPGEWVVEVTLKDNVAGIVIPLKTSFVLLKDKANKSSKRDAVTGAPS